MRLIEKLLIFTFVIMVTGCGLMPPRRQYIKLIRKQAAPKEILNSEWSLESFDNKAPDCSLSLKFLDKGQLTFKFKDHEYRGDFLWYLVKDSLIEFHTRPLEKFAWTSDKCEMNPSAFALYLHGDKKVIIADNKLRFDTFDKKRFVFRKQ